MNDWSHKLLIARIIHIIVMGEIASLFFFAREVVFLVHGYRVAIWASVIMLIIAFDVGVVKLSRGRAYGAIHRWSIGKECEN